MSPIHDKRKSIGKFFTSYGQISLAWLLIAGAFGLLMWQVYGLSLAGAWALIQSESYRPVGWSRSTIRGVSRCVIPSVVTIWLVAVMYAWNRLEDEFKLPRFWPRVGRVTGIILGLYGVTIILLRVI